MFFYYKRTDNKLQERAKSLHPPQILRRNKQGKAPRCDALLGALVRVVRLERTVSWSQTRRDTNFAIPGYSISAMIPRRTVKIKFFLSVVNPVVKAAFMPPSATGESPANAGVARLCGVSPCPVPDTATALPKQARYQLRYTRLLSFYPAGRILPNQARYQLRYTRIPP